MAIPCCSLNIKKTSVFLVVCALFAAACSYSCYGAGVSFPDKDWCIKFKGRVICPFKCPTDSSFDNACLRSAIPPWPLCKFHTVPEFVEYAKDSATRCCGDDTSLCRCPKMKSAKFQNNIGEWCRGIASCNLDDEEDDSSEVKDDWQVSESEILIKVIKEV